MKKRAPAAGELVAVPAPLEPSQAAALDALAEGQTAQQAAEAAGVPLAELLAWAADDPAFIAAGNRRRRMLVKLQADTLRGLAGRALGVLASALDAPADTPAGALLRVKAAAAILRVAQAEPPPAWGPESAEGVREMWEQAEQQAEQDRRMRALLATIGP